MKNTLFILAAAALSLAACSKVQSSVTTPSGEMSVIPVNSDAASSTRGYVEDSNFSETTYETLHAGTKASLDRSMQISAYLTPQDGVARNYFENKCYKKDGSTWRNHNGTDYEPIYWPVGGKLDFLAYSVSAEDGGAGSSKNIDAVWNSTNAASQLVLTVPAENSQNDILFASAYGIQSRKDSGEVPMQFRHAQAWLEFVLTGSTDAAHPDGIVTLKRIELEGAYNAGSLTVSNNLGSPVAEWNFTGQTKSDFAVDNLYDVKKLSGTAQYLDMLLPQQDKRAFVIYYTLGSSTRELSYRFEAGPDTWLMGEKYIYNICITTSEVTVAPVVTEWGQGTELNFTVSVVNSDTTFGTVTATGLGDPVGTKAAETKVYSVKGGTEATLTANPTATGIFEYWTDDIVQVADKQMTTHITSDVTWTAVFSKAVTITLATSDKALGTVTATGLGDPVEPQVYAVKKGTEATLTANPTATGIFEYWTDGKVQVTDNPMTTNITSDVTWTAVFSKPVTITLATNDKTLGTVTATGLGDPVEPPVYPVKSGTEATLTASPTAIGYFDYWTNGTVQVTDKQMTTQITSDVTWTAVFSDTPPYGDTGLKGIKIGDLFWAPVNCGYEATKYPYGLMYQWGRAVGGGYNDGSTYTEFAQTNTAASWINHFNKSPEDDKYYKTPDFPCDWYTDQKDTQLPAWPMKEGDTDYVAGKIANPCPEGWRVPTHEALATLKDGTKEWVTGRKMDGSVGGQYSGYIFGDAPNQVFFPAAGYRNYTSGNATSRGSVGGYWSSIISGTLARNLQFDSSNAQMTYSSRGFGLYVRCVR